MLRCLGLNIDTASEVYRYNLGIIQNATIKNSLLKNKHVAIIDHKVCESVSEGIIVPIQMASADNFAECLTKSLPISDHNRLINGIFYAWLTLGVRGVPFEFRVCIIFGVVYTIPIGWSETRTVSDH